MKLQTVNHNEVQRILTQARGSFAERDKPMISLLLNTGLRVSELLSLNISTVLNGTKVKEEIIIIGKGQKERLIPLNVSARVAIERIIAFNKSKDFDISPTSPLLWSRKRTRLTRWQVHHVIFSLSKSAGLDNPIHPHTLRHSFATAVLRKSNLKVVQNLLGHSSISTTAIYLHPSKEEMTAAVSAIA